MDSILSDEPSVHNLPESDETAPESAATESADSSGDVEAAPEKEAPKPAEMAGDDGEDEGPSPVDLEGFKKALAAARGDKRKERKKWQEAERKLAMFEGELTALRRQPAQPAPKAEPEAPKPGFWDGDPEKYIEAQLKTRIDAYQVESRKRMIARDERAMRRSHEDFDSAVEAFTAAAQTSPQLLASFNGDDDPVGFAYEQGKQLMRLQKYGATTLDELTEKIREELRAELSTSSAVEPASEAPVTARSPIPPKSIASSRGSGAGVTKAWSGPRPLSQILGS